MSQLMTTQVIINQEAACIPKRKKKKNVNARKYDER